MSFSSELQDAFSATLNEMGEDVKIAGETIRAVVQSVPAEGTIETGFIAEGTETRLSIAKDALTVPPTEQMPTTVRGKHSRVKRVEEFRGRFVLTLKDPLS